VHFRGSEPAKSCAGRKACGLLPSLLGNFPQGDIASPNSGNIPLGSRFLVTNHALFRSRRIHIFSILDDLVMTTATVAMKRLLIVQGDERRAFLQFDLR